MARAKGTYLSLWFSMPYALSWRWRCPESWWCFHKGYFIHAPLKPVAKALSRSYTSGCGNGCVSVAVQIRRVSNVPMNWTRLILPALWVCSNNPWAPRHRYTFEPNASVTSKRLCLHCQSGHPNNPVTSQLETGPQLSTKFVNWLYAWAI